MSHDFTPGFSPWRPFLRPRVRPTSPATLPGTPEPQIAPSPPDVEAILQRVASGTTTAADADTLRTYIQTLRGA